MDPRQGRGRVLNIIQYLLGRLTRKSRQALAGFARTHFIELP